jgi:hypothetical protein
MSGSDEKLSQSSIDDLIASLLAGGGASAGDGPAFGDDGPIFSDAGPIGDDGAQESAA